MIFLRSSIRYSRLTTRKARMSLSMNGKVSTVMTVVTRSQAMMFIIVRTVIVTTAVSVQPTVRYVILQSVLGAVMNARFAESLSVIDALRYVLIVRRLYVTTALMKKNYVKAARSRERKNKMKKKTQQSPSLRFSPTAWAKLVFLRDLTDNEVGGFGIADPDDLLLVTDFALVKQKVTPVSVSFDDDSVADFFADQVEEGRRPEEFARIWLHTHPGCSAEPSGTDEETFERVFGSCNWSVMCIVAQEGSTYARLRFNTGPGGEVKIPVFVDYSVEFDSADFQAWQKEYFENVTEDNRVLSLKSKSHKSLNGQFDNDVFGSTGFNRTKIASSEDLFEELELMHPAERQAFIDELAVRSDFWDEYESEAIYD